MRNIYVSPYPIASNKLVKVPVRTTTLNDGTEVVLKTKIKMIKVKKGS